MRPVVRAFVQPTVRLDVLLPRVTRPTAKLTYVLLPYALPLQILQYVLLLYLVHLTAARPAENPTVRPTTVRSTVYCPTRYMALTVGWFFRTSAYKCWSGCADECLRSHVAGQMLSFSR